MAWLKCKCDDHIFYEEHTLVRGYTLRQYDGECTLTIHTDNKTCSIVFGETLEEAEEKLDFLLELVRSPDVLTVDIANFTMYPGIQEELRALEELQYYTKPPKPIRKYSSIKRKQAAIC